MAKPWIRDELAWMEELVANRLRVIGFHPGTRSDELIIEILRMPFLDSVEESDLVAMQTLTDLSRRNFNLFDRAMSGLLIGPGITDDQTEIVSFLLMEQYDTNVAEAIRALPWAGDGINRRQRGKRDRGPSAVISGVPRGVLGVGTQNMDAKPLELDT